MPIFACLNDQVKPAAKVGQLCHLISRVHLISMYFIRMLFNLALLIALKRLCFRYLSPERLPSLHRTRKSVVTCHSGAVSRIVCRLRIARRACFHRLLLKTLFLYAQSTSSHTNSVGGRPVPKLASYSSIRKGRPACIIDPT